MCLRTSEQNNNLDFIFLKNAKKKQIPWVKKKGKERRAGQCRVMYMIDHCDEQASGVKGE